MKLVNKLERKYRKFAIHNLMLFVVSSNIIVYFMAMIEGNSVLEFLYFNPYLVLKGEVWRIITFVTIPPTFSIFLFLILLFYYSIGNTLERVWGSFKFNVYYFTGMLVMVLVSLIFKASADVTFLNLSLFFAFAYLFPDYEVLLYFILPVKIKYLAYLNLAFYIFQFIVGGWSARISIIAGSINFILFFGADIIRSFQTRVQTEGVKREYRQKLDRTEPRGYRHKCCVCGRTEKDDKDLEFRYCSKCDGHHEYCMEHLMTHEHIVAEKSEPTSEPTSEPKSEPKSEPTSEPKSINEE